MLLRAPEELLEEPFSIDEGGLVAVGVDFVELDASTQYEYPSQNFVTQSFETSGFSAMNCV